MGSLAIFQVTEVPILSAYSPLGFEGERLLRWTVTILFYVTGASILELTWVENDLKAETLGLHTKGTDTVGLSARVQHGI